MSNKTFKERCEAARNTVAYWKERYEIERGEIKPLERENRKLEQRCARMVRLLENEALSLRVAADYAAQVDIVTAKAMRARMRRINRELDRYRKSRFPRGS